MAIRQRRDVERIDIAEQVIEIWVGACSMSLRKLLCLDIASRPDACKLGVRHNAQTLGESMRDMACADNSPTNWVLNRALLTTKSQST